MSPGMAQGVHGFGAHPCLWAVSPQRCWVGTGDGVTPVLVCPPPTQELRGPQERWGWWQSDNGARGFLLWGKGS